MSRCLRKGAARALRIILGAHLVCGCKERVRHEGVARHPARRARHSRPAARHGSCLATNIYGDAIFSNRDPQKSVPGTDFWFRVPKIVPGTRKWYPEPENGTRNQKSVPGTQKWFPFLKPGFLKPGFLKPGLMVWLGKRERVSLLANFPKNISANRGETRRPGGRPGWRVGALLACA
jgi:hypothetical protein